MITELAVKRRQELISQSETRCLTVGEVDELQGILYSELGQDYRSGKVGFLAYLALHAIISYLGYCLRSEALGNDTHIL